MCPLNPTSECKIDCEWFKNQECLCITFMKSVISLSNHMNYLVKRPDEKQYSESINIRKI